MKKFLIFLLPLFFLSCSQMDNSSTVGLVLSSKSLRAASNIELESNAITVSASLKGEVSRQIQKKVSDFSKDTVIVFDSVPAGKNIYYCQVDQLFVSAHGTVHENLRTTKYQNTLHTLRLLSCKSC